MSDQFDQEAETRLKTVVSIGLSVDRYNQLTQLDWLEELLEIHAYTLQAKQCRCQQDTGLTIPDAMNVWGVTQWSKHVSNLIRARQVKVELKKP